MSRYIAVGADDSSVRVLDYNQATTFRIGKYSCTVFFIKLLTA